MKLINFEEGSVKISLDKDELYIIQAIVGEIYSGVCVDCRDFEIIHGVEKNKVLSLDKERKKIYDTWDKC
ncbi:hypothetical protein [Neisseria lactamica]|uniref:hypothetical protein n=1 Tax=Neisseria lactamica TaxID=486 RepID=UPI000E573089|nr:hypothetical protein [Neisseria lactamica]